MEIRPTPPGGGREEKTPSGKTLALWPWLILALAAGGIAWLSGIRVGALDPVGPVQPKAAQLDHVSLTKRPDGWEPRAKARLTFLDTWCPQPSTPVCAEEASVETLLALPGFEADFEVHRSRQIEALKKTSLAGRNLSEANLQGAFLDGQDLTGTTLVGAKLQGSVLENAVARRPTSQQTDPVSHPNCPIRLDGAWLDRADLQGAVLVGCDIADVSFAGANLAGATLRFASASGINLLGANLAGAEVRIGGPHHGLGGGFVVQTNGSTILRGARLTETHIADSLLGSLDGPDLDLTGAVVTGYDPWGDPVPLRFFGSALSRVDLSRVAFAAKPYDRLWQEQWMLALEGSFGDQTVVLPDGAEPPCYWLPGADVVGTSSRELDTYEIAYFAAWRAVRDRLLPEGAPWPPNPMLGGLALIGMTEDEIRPIPVAEIEASDEHLDFSCLDKP